MVLVLFFLGVTILISGLIIFTSILWLRIDIKNLKFKKEEKNKSKTNKDYEIIVYVYMLKKIRLFKYRINSKKVRKKYWKNMKNKLDFSILKSFILNNFDLSNVKNIEIESLNLKLNLGMENIILTSGIVTFSNILISIFLPKLITTFNKDKYNYEVKPVYENKNIIDLFLEFNIKIKLFSLIRSIKSYKEAKQRKKSKKDFNNNSYAYIKI